MSRHVFIQKQLISYLTSRWHYALCTPPPSHTHTTHTHTHAHTHPHTHTHGIMMDCVVQPCYSNPKDVSGPSVFCPLPLPRIGYLCLGSPSPTLPSTVWRPGR